MSEPHWPGGAIADPAPEGHKYLLDDDGLVIGVATEPVYVSVSDARKLYHWIGTDPPRAVDFLNGPRCAHGFPTGGRDRGLLCGWCDVERAT